MRERNYTPVHFRGRRLLLLMILAAIILVMVVAIVLACYFITENQTNMCRVVF